ncbi:MAG: threonine synthase [Spirochaetales bacterium]|nr:threonine synthase [Spirochaetales bacterium]
MRGIDCYSTNGISQDFPILEAVRSGLAPDGGLFMPRFLPSFSPEEIAGMKENTYGEIAERILVPFFPEPLKSRLAGHCREVYTFSPLLEKVDRNISVMRLDTGPTASFKDFAAVIMARIMGEAINEGEKLVILTATSGDTGSAIARAFLNVPGIEVVVLFPLEEISENQRRQITTLGEGNLQVIGLEGKFDDAQWMVKKAFTDPELKSCNLTSANSINIARLLPQTVYYFWACSRLCETGEEILFSIPSGNFGSMMGAVLAGRMGLPVKKLIIGTNTNDAFPRFLETGRYEKIVPSRKCISNAMNVGHPSNLARLIDLFGGHLDEQGALTSPPDMGRLRALFFSVPVDDHTTRRTIESAYKEHHLLLEPHGAVAWHALQQYYTESAAAGDTTAESLTAVSLETAHPAKFPEEILSLIGIHPEYPESLKNLGGREEQYTKMAADYSGFRDFLIRSFTCS